MFKPLPIIGAAYQSRARPRATRTQRVQAPPYRVRPVFAPIPSLPAHNPDPWVFDQ